MKKFLMGLLTLLMLAVVNVAFVSCGEDYPEPDPTPTSTPSPTATLVGTWKYTFEDGYSLITFNQNGTGTYSEYEDGEWETVGEVFTYTYANNVIKIIFDDDEVWTLKLISINTTTLVLWDSEDGNCTFHKQSDPEPTPTPTPSPTASLIGTWKCTYDDGYCCIMTFNQNGTGIFKEYDEGEWYSESFTYTYANNKIMCNFGDEVETYNVLSITSTKLVLQDSGNSADIDTFYRQ